jgi:5-methylthioribose kinase
MNIPVSAKYLKELEQQSRKLQALEDGGVDNWEGYDDSMSAIWKEQREKELYENVLEEVCEILCEGVYEPSERGAGFTFTDEVQDEALELIINRLKPKEENT